MSASHKKLYWNVPTKWQELVKKKWWERKAKGTEVRYTTHFTLHGMFNLLK